MAPRGRARAHRGGNEKQERQDVEAQQLHYWRRFFSKFPRATQASTLRARCSSSSAASQSPGVSVSFLSGGAHPSSSSGQNCAPLSNGSAAPPARGLLFRRAAPASRLC
ncbi:unnamed protein product [Amoebophrya sp. A120]|nr:unnamed protein product [Amoebophrya sp. A120]|eukprot:GSA120T00003195001.1